jgi:hypothetical protein
MVCVDKLNVVAMIGATRMPIIDSATMGSNLSSSGINFEAMIVSCIELSLVVFEEFGRQRS